MIIPTLVLFAQLAPALVAEGPLSLTSPADKIRATSLGPDDPVPHPAGKVRHRGPSIARPGRRADVKYWTMVGTTGAAMAFDIKTTSDWLKRPSAYEKDSALFYGRHPSDARLAGQSAALFAAESYLAYRMKGSRNRVLRRLWWVPLTIQIGQSVRGGTHNLRLLGR